jgi:hypothetical protein
MGVPLDNRCSHCNHAPEHHAPDGCRFFMASMMSHPPGPCRCPVFNWKGPDAAPDRPVGLIRDNVLAFRPRKK